MDKNKIENISRAYIELKEEITNTIILRLPKISQNSPNYLDELRSFKENCSFVIQKLPEMQKLQMEAYDKASKAIYYINSLQELYNETHGLIVPPTLGSAVSDLVSEYLTHESELIRVEDIEKQLNDKGVTLTVKNPAAVIASILARDERLEKEDKGIFKKKVIEKSNEIK